MCVGVREVWQWVCCRLPTVDGEYAYSKQKEAHSLELLRLPLPAFAFFTLLIFSAY